MRGTWWVKPDQLDDVQRQVVGLDPDGKFLVTGPPGSGKTNLLMLRADYLVKSGRPNILVLVFTRTLEEFIAHCPAPYAINSQRLRTMMRWQMEMIAQYGGTPSTTGTFADNRAANCELLEAIVEKHNFHNLYDTILLDEAQDYTEDEIELVFSLAKNVFAVGDSRQRIYEHNASMPALSSKCSLTHLPHHYRNGESICIVADSLGSAWGDYEPLSGNSQYNEKSMPSKVSVHCCSSIEKQCEAIMAAIRVQLRAYPDEMIGILCPRRRELTIVHKLFEKSDLKGLTVHQSSDEGYVPFSDTTRICLCTIHGSKGLEFRAVHIAGAEFVYRFRDIQRELAYTGVTRAKTMLDVYHTGNLAQYFQAALLAPAPPATPPTIDDLFKV